MRNRICSLVAVLFALAGMGAASAQSVIFNLTPTSSTVSPGDTIQFFADVTNPGPDDVTLDSLSSTFLPDLDRDEDFTPFFTNFAGPLTAGSSIPSSGPQLEIYDLRVLPTAGLGDYAGSLTIFDPAGVELGVADFRVTVQSSQPPPPPGFVPEPGAIVQLLALPFACLLFSRLPKKSHKLS